MPETITELRVHRLHASSRPQVAPPENIATNPFQDTADRHFPSYSWSANVQSTLADQLYRAFASQESLRAYLSEQIQASVERLLKNGIRKPVDIPGVRKAGVEWDDMREVAAGPPWHAITTCIN